MYMYHHLNEKKIVKSIRSGLITLIPILLTGSFALVFRSLPIPFWQKFIQDFGDGIIYHLFDLVYRSTYGILSLLMTVSISYHYVLLCSNDSKNAIIASITSTACFALLSGILSTDFDISAFGVKGMFNAIFSALLATIIYLKVSRYTNPAVHIYSDGADIDFNHSISMLKAVVFTISSFALFDYAVITIFHVSSFHDFFILTIDSIFGSMGNNFLSGFCFILCSSLCWFFGIHGSDIFEDMVSKQFTPCIEINHAAVLAGEQGNYILTKQFFDTFVLMGGCGTTLCLLFSILIVGKRRSVRGIAKAAAFPMIFNINEIMVFGLPIIYNTILLIPFLLTPICTYLTSYLAIKLGLVPVTSNAIEWTTPVLLSGYLTCNSIRGALLQLFNLCLGTLIYIPFVKKNDCFLEEAAQSRLEQLIAAYKEAESKNQSIQLCSVDSSMANSLIADLKIAYQSNGLELYFQPQFNEVLHIHGSEALLRWNHPTFGFIYPPLIIQLAKEGKFLTELEIYIMKSAIQAQTQIAGNTSSQRICVNVTSESLLSKEYLNALQKYKNNPLVQQHNVCIELTEQTALNLNETSLSICREIAAMGYRMAIDDFSMGATSVKYLESGLFSWIKLDGSLTRNIMTNERSAEIVSAIIHMAEKMHMNVLAEYVETKEQLNLLLSKGCRNYQGYYVGKAVTKDEFIKCVNSRSN